MPSPMRTCKKCGFQSANLSVFMSHIRKERFWNTNAKTKKIKKQKQTKELTVRQVLALNNGATTFEKPQLSALDLLQKLKEQRDLMITVVSMIEGVINQ